MSAFLFRPFSLTVTVGWGFGVYLLNIVSAIAPLPTGTPAASLPATLDSPQPLQKYNSIQSDTGRLSPSSDRYSRKSRPLNTVFVHEQLFCQNGCCSLPTELVQLLSTTILTDPWFYMTAIPAVLIVGIAKGGLGGGLGVVGVPLMAMAISPLRAAAIMLPILILMDVHALWNFRRQGDPDNLKILLPAALLGIVLGAFTFRYLSAPQVRVLVGIIAISFVLHAFIKGRNLQANVPNRITGYFWGAVAGFTSFGVHAGGPPINVYLLPQKLNKTTFQATTVVFFAVVNMVKLLPYAWLGQLNSNNLHISLLLCPLAPIGISMGYYLHNRINEKLFFAVIYISLVVVGMKLIFDGMQIQ